MYAEMVKADSIEAQRHSLLHAHGIATDISAEARG